VSAALAGERDRIAAAVGELIGRRLHGATLEVSAALQSGAVAVEDRLHAALHHLDAAVKEARRLVHPVPLTSPAPEDERDRELRRTRVLLDQLLVARSAHRPHLGRRPVDRVPHR
jgi:hypothetical protein